MQLESIDLKKLIYQLFMTFSPTRYIGRKNIALEFFAICWAIANTKERTKSLQINKRKRDVLKLIKGLDIPHYLYINAVKKYQALGDLLNRNGLECDVYSQGSFATGTVIRPLKDGKDANYDLDVIVVIHEDKSTTTPGEIKGVVGEIISSCKRYNKEPTEYDTCWTIEFADENGIGFNIDVVPCVAEDADKVFLLQSKANPSTKQYVDKSVAITNRVNKNQYEWWTNNPMGYKEWFDEINEPFRKYNQDERRRLFEKSQVFDESAEMVPLPPDEERSSLQIAIQILKRHRDIFYQGMNSELKPISAIITTMATTVAQNAAKDLDPFDLLSYIVSEIDEYAGLDVLTESTGVFAAKTMVTKSHGKWIMSNPVNPDDNLLDSWNTSDGQLKAKTFFKWLKEVKEIFLDSFSYNEDFRFYDALCKSLGSDYVNKSEISSKYVPAPQPVHPAKPWRNTLK